MPVFGTGIVPSGAIGTEMAAVTRRAFLPRLVVQIYKASPVLNMLFRGSQNAKGGVSQLTQPVQGASMVTAQWTDFGGAFNQPADVATMQNAEANLCAACVPIPFFGMEALIQASEVVIPRLKAKMADAKQTMVQLLSTALFTATGATPSTVMYGLPQAYDDGTNFSTYANINRSTNTFWQSKLVTSAGAVLSRTKFITYLLQNTFNAGGEAPDLVILSLNDWTTLMEDFMSVEQYQTWPGTRYGKDVPVNAGFRALMLGDTPIVADLYCPKGTAFLVNTKYFALYLSEDANWAFSGFYSTIPNLQIANIGVVLIVLQTLCTKPISGQQITGITGGASF